VNRFLYSCLLYLATPFIVIRLLVRAIRAPAYLKRWSERFAWYGGPARKPIDIIIHAVSVGEVHAALPLIRKLPGQDAALRILVTTMTPTGSARVMALSEDRIDHVYLPYDLPGAVNRFLNHWQPRVLVIMETELWPNLIHACKRRGIRTFVASARLSEKSEAGYARFNPLVKHMLAELDRVSTQSEADSKRLQNLGLPEPRVVVTGNLKYDMDLDKVQLDQARRDKATLGGRPVLIAASTRVLDGVVEDHKVLEAYRLLQLSHPELLLVLVPRHPERFNNVYTLISEHGLKAVRRSQGQVVEQEHQVLLGDTMGEMAYFYGLADVAFVGGSLVDTGCQSIIEPAALGLPVITGPSLFNFQAVSEALQEAGGMTVVTNEDGLAATVKTLLEEPALCRTMGDAASRVVKANQGAVDRNLAIISELLASAAR
jgi:3-deoxy-D-manno-octulosonic-acid transferase